MKTLAEAYRTKKSQLTGEYLMEIGCTGEDLVKRVNRINKTLENIRAAIKLHGKDFLVPTCDDEIPSEGRELFFGCANW